MYKRHDHTKKYTVLAIGKIIIDITPVNITNVRI